MGKIKCSKILTALLLAMVFTLCFSSCSASTGSDALQVTDEYIEAISKFYDLGTDYTELGMQIQAGYAYGYAAASISSMRLCVDTLLHMAGEGANLEEVLGDRTGDWDALASFNYASPFPWLFQGLSLHAQNRAEEAQECYHNAALNPDFDIKSGDVILFELANMSGDELKTFKEKLTKLEDRIYATYTPEPNLYPRDKYGFSALYLTSLAQEELEASEGDFTGALRHYEAALSVDPFDGDNFVSCALACLYLGDMDKTFFYVNEGLLADPQHEGLSVLAKRLNEGRGQ